MEKAWLCVSRLGRPERVLRLSLAGAFARRGAARQHAATASEEQATPRGGKCSEVGCRK